VNNTQVRERYSPDDGGERDITGVKGRISDDGKLDGEERCDDDGEEEDIGEGDS
jgi:hypothetical protein